MTRLYKVFSPIGLYSAQLITKEEVIALASTLGEHWIALFGADVTVFDGVEIYLWISTHYNLHAEPGFDEEFWPFLQDTLKEFPQTSIGVSFSKHVDNGDWFALKFASLCAQKWPVALHIEDGSTYVLNQQESIKLYETKKLPASVQRKHIPWANVDIEDTN